METPKSFEIPVWFLYLSQYGTTKYLHQVLKSFSLDIGPVKTDQTVTITYKEVK